MSNIIHKQDIKQDENIGNHGYTILLDFRYIFGNIDEYFYKNIRKLKLMKTCGNAWGKLQEIIEDLKNKK